VTIYLHVAPSSGHHKCHPLSSRKVQSFQREKAQGLAVSAKSPRLNCFIEQNFEAATLKQWRLPEHLKM